MQLIYKKLTFRRAKAADMFILCVYLGCTRFVTILFPICTQFVPFLYSCCNRFAIHL